MLSTVLACLQAPPAEDELAPVPGQRRMPHPDYRFLSWFVEEEQLLPGQHDDIADIIKEEIWPNPMKYYKGEMPDVRDVCAVPVFR